MRLRTIDALRGIASLMVVWYHGIGGFTVYLASPSLLSVLPAYGYAGVYLFFVISGFCIHLRWVKGHEPEFFPFWKRRIVRLYPAYIATLILFLWWNGWTNAWDVLLHLVMLHNWTPETVYSINGVLWTLAVEEQLYLLYFVLLKMRVRFGWPVTLAILLGLRFALFPVFHLAGIPFAESALTTWFVWALGALAVEVYYRKVNLPHVSAFTSVPFLAAAAGLHYLAFAQYGRVFWIADTLFEQVAWGVGFYFVLLAVLRLENTKSRIVAVFAFIGVFSYSLYLTHLIVPVWAAIPLAYVFFLVFERPSMKLLSRPTYRNVVTRQ